MPSEACYLVSIETGILLCLVYGILSSYFEDVMGFGFLFFAVFAGMSVAYVSIVSGFCLLLFDDTTNRQIILLEDTNPQRAPAKTLNGTAQLARVLARSGAVSVVAMFILFVTVCVEFFTEDRASEPDSLATVGLKKAPTESFLSTQFAVSTALAVFFILLVMILSNSQQLTGLLVRLEHMTLGGGAEHTPLTSTSDDLALFLRTLLIAYVIVCDSVGTFKHLPDASITAALLDALPASVLDFLRGVRDSTWLLFIFDLRNSTSLLVLAWFLLLGVAETFLPLIISFVLIKLMYVVQLFLSLVAIEILLDDITLTNVACVVVLSCDACLIVYTSVYRIYSGIRGRKWFSKQATGASATESEEAHTAPYTKCRTVVLCENECSSQFDINNKQINIDSLNFHIFQKKSN